MHSAHQPDYATLVGTATHRVIAQLLPRVATTPPETLLDEAWEHAGRLLARVPIGRRVRAARLTVSGGTAVYLDCLRLGEGWTLLGSEVRLGDAGIVDLAWRRADGAVVFDELKTTATRQLPVGDGPTLRQAQRYTEAGARLYGPAFLGTRVLFLSAPYRSWFVLPSGARVDLAGIDLDDLGSAD